jgi:hypothetical protein
MPNGGQLTSGSGLRLQAVTPGVQDNGNANINGVMIANRFSTSQNNISNLLEQFGHNITFTIQPPIDAVACGAGLDFGSGLNAGGALLGINCGLYSPTSVSIGQGCIAGKAPNDGNPNKVAIGKDCFAGSAAGSVANQVAMGLSCTANGAGSVAVGINVKFTGNISGQSVGIGFGKDITSDAATLQAIAFGKGIITNTRINLLAIGWWDGGGPNYPIAGAGAVDNSILIGNVNQNIVRIGSFIIGSLIRVPVADANYNILGTEQVVAYTSILAPRIVNLLAANAVPAGKPFLVVDESGSVTAVNTITVTAAGADTINGVATKAIIVAYGFTEVMSDGVSKWTVIR